MTRFWWKNGLMWAAGVLVALTAGLVLFVALSELPVANPHLGVFLYSLLPVFFVAGAVVFYLALQREKG